MIYIHEDCSTDNTARINVANSLTTKWKKYDKRQQVEEANSYITMMNEIDELSRGCYTDSIWKMKAGYIENLIACEGFRGNSEEKIRAFREATMWRKIWILVKLFLPDRLYMFLSGRS